MRIGSGVPVWPQVHAETVFSPGFQALSDLPASGPMPVNMAAWLKRVRAGCTIVRFYATAEVLLL